MTDSPYLNNQFIEEISSYFRDYLIQENKNDIQFPEIYKVLREKYDSISESDIIALFEKNNTKELNRIDGLMKSDNSWIIKLTPAILYHYTSTDVLTAIMNNTFKSADGDETLINIRATNALYMNDPVEVKYFTDNLCKCYDPHGENRPLQNRMFTSLSELGKHKRTLYYVFSLSEHNDELVMWRGYGRNGKGICIGFDYHKLNNRFNGEIFKCKYVTKDDIRQFAEENQSLKEFIEDRRSFHGIMDYLKLWEVIYKHPAYKEEKEWRILTKDDIFHTKEVLFDSKEGFVYPYMNIPIPINYIKEIIVGPCAEQHLNLQSIDQLVTKRMTHGGRLKTKLSEVPYVAR